MQPVRLHCMMAMLGTLGLLAQSVAAATIALVPLNDNTIYSENGATSNGAGQHLFAGVTATSNIRRALISFDVAGSVPAGATITGATLKLFMSRQNDPVSRTMSLHRVTRAWGEGTSNASANEGRGAPATTGDATWTFAFFSTSSWTSPGGDYSATASASKVVGGVDSYHWTSAQVIADVQAWLDSPGNDHGWILLGDESDTSSRRFDSVQHPSSSNRPTLTIDFEVTTSTPPSGRPEVVTVRAYPNPFNPVTTFSVQTPAPRRVSISIYDLRGRRLRVLADDMLVEREAELRWDGRSATGERLPSGIYVYAVTGGAERLVGKLALLQ